MSIDSVSKIMTCKRERERDKFVSEREICECIDWHACVPLIMFHRPVGQWAAPSLLLNWLPRLVPTLAAGMWWLTPLLCFSFQWTRSAILPSPSSWCFSPLHLQVPPPCKHATWMLKSFLRWWSLVDCWLLRACHWMQLLSCSNNNILLISYKLA